MLRMFEMAAASFEARREERRFGIATAAMMPMIATTIINSTSEKPSGPRLFFTCSTALLRVYLGRARLPPAPSVVVSGYAPVSRDCVSLTRSAGRAAPRPRGPHAPGLLKGKGEGKA